MILQRLNLTIELLTLESTLSQLHANLVVKGGVSDELISPKALDKGKTMDGSLCAVPAVLEALSTKGIATVRTSASRGWKQRHLYATLFMSAAKVKGWVKFTNNQKMHL